MRALANRSNRSRNHNLLPSHPSRAAAQAVAARSALVRACKPLLPARPEMPDAATFADLPAETDAWWLFRSQQATFARRTIALPEACARALAALREGETPILVEFNGATFEGAAVAANEGRCELHLGDALAQEMAEVLDEDDGLAFEMVGGRAKPTLAIHPYVGSAG